MKKGRSFKDKMIWVKSGLCVLLGISVAGGIWFKVKKNRKEDNLEEIAKEVFDCYLKDRMKQVEKEGIEWRYQLNRIELVGNDKDEFIVVVNYDLIVDDEYEREYTTEQWMMKIRRFKDKRYEVIDQGETVTDDHSRSK